MTNLSLPPITMSVATYVRACTGNAEQRAQGGGRWLCAGYVLDNPVFLRCALCLCHVKR
jgi:hypothetical protein